MRSLRTTCARGWILPVLLALAPMWLIGTLDRGAWTPDEPREADIAWRMSVQSHWVLPQLAGQPFLEKPPLSYWVSAGSMRLFGPSARAARVPNLLYAAITAMAIGALGFAMDGVTAAIVAALVASTAITAFRVTMWLAPDACLLAGCSVALLGAYLGYTAAPGRRKLYGYLLMHAGAAVGFMAKSAPGWLVPALALLTLAEHGSRARLLVLLPGHASGELTPLLERLDLAGAAPGDGIAGELASTGISSIVRRYRLPHGRRYALLAPPTSGY